MVAISVDLACLDERGFGGWEFLGIGKWEVDGQTDSMDKI